MVKVLTDQGEIGISNAVFTTITGAAATNCFGVKGMAYRSMTAACKKCYCKCGNTNAHRN